MKFTKEWPKKAGLYWAVVEDGMPEVVEVSGDSLHAWRTGCNDSVWHLVFGDRIEVPEVAPDDWEPKFCCECGREEPYTKPPPPIDWSDWTRITEDTVAESGVKYIVDNGATLTVPEGIDIGGVAVRSGECNLRERRTPLSVLHTIEMPPGDTP